MPVFLAPFLIWEGRKGRGVYSSVPTSDTSGSLAGCFGMMEPDELSLCQDQGREDSATGGPHCSRRVSNEEAATIAPLCDW